MEAMSCAGRQALAAKKKEYARRLLFWLVVLSALGLAMVGRFGIHDWSLELALVPPDLALFLTLLSWDSRCLHEHDACGCVYCQNEASKIRRAMKESARAWSRHGPC